MIKQQHWKCGSFLLLVSEFLFNCFLSHIYILVVAYVYIYIYLCSHSSVATSVVDLRLLWVPCVFLLLIVCSSSSAYALFTFIYLCFCCSVCLCHAVYVRSSRLQAQGRAYNPELKVGGVFAMPRGEQENRRGPSKPLNFDKLQQQLLVPPCLFFT